MLLNEKIKTLREEKGLSQEELANRLHIVRQTVSKWEKGLSLPDSQMLVQLAEALGTSVGFLVGEICEQRENDEKKPNRNLGTFRIVLLVMGSPVWFSLLLAALAVGFSLYIAMWSMVIALWAIFGAVIGCAFGGVVLCVKACFSGNGLVGMATIGASLICAGLSIFLFYGCKLATKGAIALTKIVVNWVRSFHFKGRKPNE